MHFVSLCCMEMCSVPFFHSPPSSDPFFTPHLTSIPMLQARGAHLDAHFKNTRETAAMIAGKSAVVRRETREYTSRRFLATLEHNIPHLIVTNI